mmetsp:Transcript_11113/g.25171  ORF Transcript_11113/g.25171 Transcript_11113/m.25171 type:complete len:102 (-) Transcript_11113:3600-3905(-)
MLKDVQPSVSSRIPERTCCSVATSRALVASSNSITGAFLAKARHSATRCFCPPDNPSPLTPSSVCQPKRRSSSNISLHREFFLPRGVGCWPLLRGVCWRFC